MEVETDSVMETPKSSVDLETTSSLQRKTTYAAEPISYSAPRQHIVPTVEPIHVLPSQQLPQLHQQDSDVHPIKPRTDSMFSTRDASEADVLEDRADEGRYITRTMSSPAPPYSLRSRTDVDYVEDPYENEFAEDSKSLQPSTLLPADSPAEVHPDVDDEVYEDGAANNNGTALDMASVDDDDNLSPPPESIESIDDQILEDQIVVAKGKAADGSNSASASAKDNYVDDLMEMDEDDDDDDVQVRANRHPKRKRNSLYEDLAEENMDSSVLGAADEDGTMASTPASDTIPTTGIFAPQHPAKPIVLGYWRESDAPEPNQHIVKGFIDSRDRLRTRIQQHNRAGDIITGRYPLKPGPGGSWVTFHNIVFDEHLVHLDQSQVKEYVKIRQTFQDQPSENPRANDKLAVQQAIKATAARGPPAENAVPPLIAYGATIPDHARISYSRAEKRRRTQAANGHLSTPDFQPPPPQRLQAGPGPAFAQQMHMSNHPPPNAELPGKRPTKIMLGFWTESIEPKLEDKHAVFGILGNNDMFRVKVGRETRDGRPMQSNFPQGAGALWINAHQWKKEDYLEDLSREELKEYCRVRQYQIDHLGERDTNQRDINIRFAIEEARRRAAFIGSSKKTNGHNVLPTNNHFSDAIRTHQGPSPSHETRQNMRRPGPTAITPATSFASEQQGPPTPGFRAAHRGNGLPPPINDPRLERASSLAVNAISRIEASQQKVEERDAHMMAAPPYQMGNGQNGGPNHPDSFRENLGRLNNVWHQQQAQHSRNGEDAKFHAGTKYERKATGPFAGKLVSQGNIISIDGEDYVEYRVLTKPSFI